MPPKDPKRIRPKLRGERWQLHDGRNVVLLELLGVNDLGARSYEILNERGALEAVYEAEFSKRLYPEEAQG